MDINQLAKALTLNTNNLERVKNEEYINQMKLKENYASALLNISCDSKFTPEIQLIAGIQLKNFITQNWKYGNDSNLNVQLRFEDNEAIVVIKQEEKEFIKTHILDALVYSTANMKLMKQFNQAIKKIVKLDYDNWKEFFMGKIVEHFKSGDDNKIFAGIIAFYQMSKIYEFESGEYKLNYKKSWEIANDFLLSFLNGLVQNINNKQVSLIIYKIFKIYFKTIQLDISPSIIDPKNFESWNLYIISVIRHHLPEEFNRKTEKTDEIEELNKNIFWKLKKICFQTIYRLYQKYGYSELVEKENLIGFSKMIETQYVKVYFDACINTLLKSKTDYISDYVLCLIYKFLSQMLVRYHFIDEIEKHLEAILMDNIVQNAMVTMKDVELWKSDPKTYINKQFDITENYYITRYSVCQFIKTLCTFKRKNEKGKQVGKSPYYEPCFKYLVGILEIYETEISQGNNTDVRIKESVLYILQSIAPTIINRSRDAVENLIEKFVLKEFDSIFPFLRERACTFIECFGDYDFKNQNLLNEITKKICFILDQEAELPVKVMAAIAAPELLKNQGVKELLSSHVSKLLEIYLNLINTIDLEEILDGLETIISRFNHQVKDYAVALTFELVKLFKKLTTAEQEEEDIKGEKLMVIEGVLRTLLKIIELFINNNEVYPQIETSIHEIIMWGLQQENFENLDDTLDFIHTILKKGNKISQNTWAYLPEIIFSLIGTEEEVAEFKVNYPKLEFEGLGYENIHDIVPIICHYITKDPDTFLTGVDKYSVSYLNRTKLLVQRIISLSKHKKEYSNMRYGLKILLVIIDTFKGKIDEIVKEILGFIINELGAKSIRYTYKMALLEIVSACFNYNPILAAQVIERENFVEQLFQKWIQAIPQMKLESELKRTLMAFISIIMVGPDSQNKEILKNIPVIIGEIINISGKLDKKRQKRFEENAVEVNDEEAEDEDRDQMLDRLLAKAKGSTGLNDFKSPEEGDDDELIEEEEEEDEDWDEFSSLNDISPVEKFNEILFIRDGFQAILQNNPAYYEELMKLIDNESKIKLETYIKNEETRNVPSTSQK